MRERMRIGVRMTIRMRNWWGGGRIESGIGRDSRGGREWVARLGHLVLHGGLLPELGAVVEGLRLLVRLRGQGRPQHLLRQGRAHRLGLKGPRVGLVSKEKNERRMREECRESGGRVNVCM